MMTPQAHTALVVSAMEGFAELVEAKCPAAATCLAEMYLRGEGIPRDVEKGLQLLRLAVSWGYAKAAFNLGARYRSGADGVPHDVVASRRYSLLAEELGFEIPVDPFLQ